jgi:hypothetical protein
LFVVVATLSLVRREQSRNPNVFLLFFKPRESFWAVYFISVRAHWDERREEKSNAVIVWPLRIDPCVCVCTCGKMMGA